MHEMALCQGLMGLIEDQQRLDPFEKVERVVVNIGALGHVDPHALEFAFEVVRQNTVAATADLQIIETSGEGWCIDCSEMTELARRGDACPKCGGYSIIVEQGEELKLTALEVI